MRDGGLGVRCASTLALSAFLASAANTSELQACILPTESAEIPYELANSALTAWMTLTGAESPTGAATHRQKEWDLRCTDKALTGLLESTGCPRDRARLLASRAPHSGDWMLAPPVTALGLRLSDEEVRIAVGVRLGTTLYEPHLCHHCRQRSYTTEEKVKWGKAAARAAMSNLASCWWVSSQMNWVSVELSRSRLDDIQASKATMIELITRVVATESEAEQCK